MLRIRREISTALPAEPGETKREMRACQHIPALRERVDHLALCQIELRAAGIDFVEAAALIVAIVDDEFPAIDTRFRRLQLRDALLALCRSQGLDFLQREGGTTRVSRSSTAGLLVVAMKRRTTSGSNSKTTPR
jgi:hypothetical protein